MDVILKKRLRQLAVVVLLATILPFVSFPFMPHFLFVVATDSMSPTINRGDIVVISDSAVENASIVVFRNPINEGYEVHRICGTKRVGNHAYYVTKGDAIDQTDSFLIPQENVVGVVSAIVPYIGLYYLIPRLPALLITISFIVLYVTIAFYENRRRNPEEKPEEKTSRNRKGKNQRTKKPTAKKMGAAALALFLISVLVQPPLMLAGVNLVYPGSQHPATVTTPKIAFQNGIEGSSTIGDEGNSATVSVSAPVPTYDFVDNNTSDVDLGADKGTHSDFAAQQYGPDSIYDTLTEENTGGWKVQSGTGSIGLGNTYTTANINPVTLSNSFLLVKFGGGIAGTQPEQDVIVSGKFNSASQLRFDRIGTTNPANFGWYVVEALGTQISVQSGTTELASTETQKDVTITDVTDTSKCVIFLSRRSTGTDRTQYNKCFVTGELTSATNLRLKRQGTGTIVTVEWFVVKFNDGTTIQTGETAVGTSNPTTQSITSVDLSRTWLYFTWRATANGLAQVSPRGWLESSTEIRWFRQTTTGICYVRWFVIQMPSGTSVQRGYHDSAVTTEYTKDITITSVALNRAFSFTTNDCTGTGNYFPRPFWIERITNTTNLRLERWYAGQASDHNWQIIELPTGNYELDLEVQWTDIPALLPNEELCIYGGTMGSEDVKVDVWNGSAWKNVFTDLSTGWNNVSITSYLNGSTFTIRFKGATETGDTNQDSWEIDATLLHVWTGGSDYDYVLKVVNQVADNWKVNLKVYGSSNIGRLLSLNISLHDSNSSDQIIVSGGNITQSEGPLYDLAGNTTIYISMSNLQATTSDVSYLYVYLKAQIPGSGIHVQLQITFQIT